MSIGSDYTRAECTQVGGVKRGDVCYGPGMLRAAAGPIETRGIETTRKSQVLAPSAAHATYEAKQMQDSEPRIVVPGFKFWSGLLGRGGPGVACDGVGENSLVAVTPAGRPLGKPSVPYIPSASVLIKQNKATHVHYCQWVVVRLSSECTQAAAEHAYGGDAGTRALSLSHTCGHTGRARTVLDWVVLR